MLHAPSNPISLKRRVLDAGAWSLGGYGLGQVIRFGSNLVLTRLLVPQMFGVMAIAMVIMVGLALFSDLGLSANIVQSRRGNDPAFLNTAWSVQIVRGALLWLSALGIAALLALANRIGVVPHESVYANRQLPLVIALVSFSAVIAGFNSTKLFEANRNLALKRVTIIDLVAQVAALFFMFAWIYFDRSIWALVGGAIFGSSATTILTHWWLPGAANRWHWDRSAFSEILHFGKWMFLSSIFGFLAMNSDRLLLGGMIDPTMLGIYVIAFNIYSAVERVLTRLVAGVIFPALSEIVRERPADLKAGYYRLHAAIAPIAYISSGGLMICGPSLIGFLYDPRYAAAGWMLAILATALLTVPFQISLQCFLALGKPQLYTIINVVRLVTLLVAMPLGFRLFGLPGALWGFVASTLFCVPVIVLQSLRHNLLDFRRELIAVPAIGVGIVIGKLVTAVTSLL